MDFVDTSKEEQQQITKEKIQLLQRNQIATISQLAKKKNLDFTFLNHLGNLVDCEEYRLHLDRKWSLREETKFIENTNKFYKSIDILTGQSKYTSC